MYLSRAVVRMEHYTVLSFRILEKGVMADSFE